MARAIDQFLAAIRQAIYGRDVREAIASGIEQCYDDSTASAQKADIEAKGAEVLASIPDTYEDLQNDVDNLNSAFVDNNKNELPDYDNGIKRFPGEFVFGVLNAQGEIQEYAANTRCVSVDYYTAKPEYLTLDSDCQVIICEYNNSTHALISRIVLSGPRKVSLTSGNAYRVCIWSTATSNPQTSPYQYASKAHLETNTEKRFDAIDTRFDSTDASITTTFNTANANTAEKTGLLGLIESAITANGYIPTNIDPVDITDIRSDASFGYLVESCNEGDVYHITGTGGNGGRLYCFVDTNGNVLSVAKNSVVFSEQYVIAPAGSAYIIVNVRTNADYRVYKLLPFCDVLITPNTNEYKYGDVRSGTVFEGTKKSIITTDFIDTSMITGVIGADNGYKYAVAVFNGSKHVRTDYWYSANQKYTFADGYNYLIYIKNQAETEMYDFSGPSSSIRYIISSDYMHKQYNNHIVQIDALRNDYSKSLEKIMKSQYDLCYANANNPISLKSYFGNNQNVHPKVLYFPELFGNHKYWMAYTPYPWNDSDYENPCIAYSDNGYDWENISGNPLDDPNGVGYNSDTHLVYRSDTNKLEVWYRYVSDYSVEPVTETIYRQTSSDGITWSAKETVYVNDSGSYSSFLSPAVLWDGTKYNLWVVNWSEKAIKYYTLTTNFTMTFVRNISLSYSYNGINYNPWHMDVILDGSNYIVLVMCKQQELTRGAWSLFMATSTDNITYGTPYPVILGSADNWDKYMYRSTIVKVGNVYRIYYSALDDAYVHGIGISESTELNNFIGKIVN